MRFAVSSDERTHLVDFVIGKLEALGHEVVYFGPQAGQEADWPDVTVEAAGLVASGEADAAVVMCWTGTGCTIAANKLPGIRAALCGDAETARGSRVWNHANVLALSLRATPEAVAEEILKAWLETPYSGDQWNRDQIAKIAALDERTERPGQSGV